MTTDILVDLGEEELVKNGLDASTLTIGVYNDATDGLSDTSTVSDITTEPTNTNYATQTATFAAVQISGDWGVDNDSSISFDFSDQSTSETVDAFYISDGAGNLYATAAMTQNRDIGSIDSLDVAAGDLEITVD
jgi:hypothetical protein